MKYYNGSEWKSEDLASPTEDGLMSKEDKATLDNASQYGKEFLTNADASSARAKLGLSEGATTSAGTASELNTGTGTTNRVWTPKAIADFVGSVKSVINVKDFGAKGDGSADDTASITSAINSAEANQTVYVPPGTYSLNTTINIINKSVTVNAEGATFVKQSNSTEHGLINFTSGFEAIYPVSSLETTWITTPTGGVSGVKITLSSTPEWKPGDTVKIIADDEIPDSIGGSETHVPRVGQFLTVWGVETNTAYLSGVLFDTYSNNIKIAKIKDNRLQWNGGSFTTNDTGGDIFTITSAYRPIIENVNVISCQATSVKFEGCFAPVARNIYVGWGPNNTVTYQNGYAVTIGNSQDSSISGIRAYQVRHAIDGGGQTQIPAGGNQFHKYGRTFNAWVSDVICDSPTSSAYSMHTGAVGVHFDTCTVRNGGGENQNTYGFGIRGLYHSITNCVVQETAKAVVLFDANPGLSYGITIDGLECYNVGNVFTSFVGERVGSPQYKNREQVKNIIRNVYARQMRTKSQIFDINNGTYVIDNIYVELNGSMPATSNMQVNNSTIYGRDWDIDFAKINGGYNPFLTLNPDYLNKIDLRNVRLLNNGNRVTKFISNNEVQDIKFRDVVFDAVPAVISDNITRSGVQDWEANANSSINSGIINNTTGAFSNRIVLSRRDVIIATWTVESNTTVSSFLTAGRLGQQLIVVNTSSTSTVTIQHGTNYRTKLLGDTDKTLQPGESIKLIAVEPNLWRQI